MPTLSRDPYAPPAAPVADFVKVVVRTRPRPVAAALVLLWAALFLDVVSWFIVLAIDPLEVLKPENERRDFWLDFAVSAGRILIATWLILRIAAARNWARITFLILILAAVPVFVPRFQLFLMLLDFPEPPLLVVAIIWNVVPLLNLAALFLLFFPGRRWFRIEA